MQPGLTDASSVLALQGPFSVLRMASGMLIRRIWRHTIVKSDQRRIIAGCPAALQLLSANAFLRVALVSLWQTMNL